MAYDKTFNTISTVRCISDMAKILVALENFSITGEGKTPVPGKYIMVTIDNPACGNYAFNIFHTQLIEVDEQRNGKNWIFTFVNFGPSSISKATFKKDSKVNETCLYGIRHTTLLIPEDNAEDVANALNKYNVDFRALR